MDGIKWWPELTCLSNLPGLVKAGSRISGKFVAAINIMPYRKNVKHIQKHIKQLINNTTCLYVPHSVQSHPFRQAIDAMFSLYGLPIVFLWTQQHLFHRWKLYKEPMKDGIGIWHNQKHTLKQQVYICLLM